MSLARFLRSLYAGDRLALPPLPTDGGLELSPEAGTDLRGVLDAIDARSRRTLAGEPPALLIPAARWGAEMLFRGCQFLLHREVSAATIRRGLAPRYSEPSRPEVVYSVDLSLRFLPDLFTIARDLGPDDPLPVAFRELARAWPLSSVGMGNLGRPLELDAFVDDFSLRQLYVDRVLERNDATRLDDSRIVRSVRETLGAHSQLAPGIARALESLTA